MLEIIERLFLATITSGLLFLSAWGWHYLHQETTYPIKTVRFIGTYHHLSPKMLEQTALPYVMTGFFAVDYYGLQKKISALPWVSQAEVYRRWPDALDIKFKEQHAVARWGQNAVMNEQGELFEPEAESIPKNLPTFNAETKQAKLILHAYQDLSKIVQEKDLRIKEIHVSPSGSWAVVFSNELTVKLGRKDQLPRMQRFIESCNGVFKSRLHAVESVDLRYPRGMAVKWLPKALSKEKNKQQPLALARSTHPNVKKTR